MKNVMMGIKMQATNVLTVNLKDVAILLLTLTKNVTMETL